MKTAILIQGKFYNNFTNKLIEKYCTEYTNCIVLLSCWESCDIELSNFPYFNFILLKNIYPDFPGPQNINYQTTTTYNGLIQLKQLGIEKVIKTRSDHYISDFSTFFNINSNKITVLKSSKFSTSIFFICDFVLWGDINNLINYFSIDIIKTADDRNLLLTNKEILKREFKHYFLNSYFLAEYLYAYNYYNKFKTQNANFSISSYCWYKFSFKNFEYVNINLYTAKTIKSYKSMLYNDEEHLISPIILTSKYILNLVLIFIKIVIKYPFV